MSEVRGLAQVNSLCSVMPAIRCLLFGQGCRSSWPSPTDGQRTTAAALAKGLSTGDKHPSRDVSKGPPVTNLLLGINTCAVVLASVPKCTTKPNIFRQALHLRTQFCKAQRLQEIDGAYAPPDTLTLGREKQERQTTRHYVVSWLVNRSKDAHLDSEFQW